MINNLFSIKKFTSNDRVVNFAYHLAKVRGNFHEIYHSPNRVYRKICQNIPFFPTIDAGHRDPLRILQIFLLVRTHFEASNTPLSSVVRPFADCLHAEFFLPESPQRRLAYFLFRRKRNYLRQRVCSTSAFVECQFPVEISNEF